MLWRGCSGLHLRSRCRSPAWCGASLCGDFSSTNLLLYFCVYQPGSDTTFLFLALHGSPRTCPSRVTHRSLAIVNSARVCHCAVCVVLVNQQACACSSVMRASREGGPVLRCGTGRQSVRRQPGLLRHAWGRRCSVWRCAPSGLLTCSLLACCFGLCDASDRHTVDVAIYHAARNCGQPSRECCPGENFCFSVFNLECVPEADIPPVAVPITGDTCFRAGGALCCPAGCCSRVWAC